MKIEGKRVNAFPAPEDALPRDKAKGRGAAAGLTHFCQVDALLCCRREGGAGGDKRWVEEGCDSAAPTACPFASGSVAHLP